ncbi:MAG TPA: sigma-70 family RNA polymerase sigma factor [Phycisphaerales bacterium]|nr:sigma-70 family RNA polymerase sigma factor [Phycisphaerales bacterium]
MPQAVTAPPPLKPAAAPARPDDTGSLTRAVARGDAAAFAVLYERWFGRVYGAARRLTGRDEAFCLDVAQEAMMKAAARMPAIDSEAALSRWLCRVVHRAALDQLRRERRRRSRERGREAPGAAPDGALAERIDWLRARLRELSAEERGLLASRFARERSLEQLGAELGTTGDAAHGRLRRALARLRSAAEERP